MSKAVTFVFLAIFILGLAGCSDSPETSGQKRSGDVHPGDYYSFVTGDGEYKVLKVLAVEKDLIHVCYYNNIFKNAPAKDVVSSLFFGSKKSDDASIDVQDGQQTTGRKHIALTFENWGHWQPQLLDSGEVIPDDLAGYEEWRSGGREVLTFKFIPAN